MIKILKSSISLLVGRTGGSRSIKLLMLFLALSNTALRAQPQNGIKVTITLNAEQLNVAMKMLQQTTKLQFAYDDKNLSKFNAPMVKFVNEPLPNVLDKLLKGTGHEYKFIQDKVVIMPVEKGNSPNVQAGGGPGTLKGRIVEFETSQPLPGASVYIVELQKGMQSNNDGYYKFTNVPAGKYTLKVTFISYKNESMQVEIKADKEETYDVKMQGSNSLNEVVVSSVRKSRAPVAYSTEKQVLEEVKQASMVVSAISSEQITKSADRNAAEVMQRVSGVTTVDDKFVIIRGLNQRYNLTYLNNNVAPSTELYSRAFALDLIPSRIIDKILVYKSPSPDNQGDATGGIVKVFTKDAKTVKHFDIEVQGGWRTGTTFKKMLTSRGGKFDFLGFDDGTRKLPSSVPAYGDFTKATISQQSYANSFSPYLYLGERTALPSTQIVANYYDSYKLFGKPLSMLTSFSYKYETQRAEYYRQQGMEGFKAIQPNDNVTIEQNDRENAQMSLLQNFTYKLRDSSNIQFKNFLLQQGLSNTIEKVFYNRTLGDARAFTNKDIVLSYSQRFLYAGNLGGTHYYQHGKHRFDWNGGLTVSSQQLPDQRVIRLQAPMQNITTGNSDYYWFARGRTGDGESTENISRLAQGIMSRTWTRNNEGIYNGSADYIYKFNPSLYLKAGTFQQWKERKVFRRVYTVHEGDYTGGFSDNSTPPGGYGNYVDPALVAFRQQDLSQIWSDKYLRDDKSGLLVVDRTSGSDAYQATEQLNSGYALFSLTPANRKIEVYGGVRVEYDRQRVGAAIPPRSSDPQGINRPVFVDIKKWDILPSVNASYRPHDNWVIRAAYGKTVNRPEFTEISPFNDYDLENNARREGNPNLRPATANNYDFRVEFYPNNNQNGETFSIGAFYKTLNNPIERVNTSSRVLNIPAVISFQNATNASIKGIEVEIRKNLNFLPGTIFKRLSVISNISFIKSEAVKDSASVAADQQPGNRVANYTIKRPLQGQAPYIINAGLYYDNAATGTKISAIYNIVGSRIYAAGQGLVNNDLIYGSEYRGSLIELPRDLIDIAITQRIVKSTQLKLSVQNLLNRSVKMAEDYNYTWKYEPEKTTVTDGVTKMEGDNIASSYNPGRFFILSFSYSF